MDNLDYIVTARHYAEKMGCGNSLERILKMRENFQTRKRITLPMQADKYSPEAVQALIENGQWIARCECGGCEFVDPDDGVFFCFSCCNRGQNHMLRNVVFPDVETRMELERLVLLRPVNDLRGQDDLERAGLARALIGIQNGKRILPLTRSWEPGETIDDLHNQQDQAIAAWERLERPAGNEMMVFKFKISEEEGKG